MSEVVPHKKAIDRADRLRVYRADLAKLDFGGGVGPVNVELSDGAKGHGTCMGCHDAPCMTLGPTDDLLPEALNEFPGDPAREICPTDALSWDDEGHAITIDADACIGCGLCVARCPYGAISMTSAGIAVVEGSDPDGLTVPTPRDAAPTAHSSVRRVGRIGTMDAPSIQAIPEHLERLSDLQNSRFVRNLLIACGVACRTRRRGDTNVRMDGVVDLANGRVGVLEIELTPAVLESPRALLEDVAVLHARYGIDVARIDPISVILRLPNARSEYFQVIADIERVLNIRCRTMTVGSLLASLWHFATIDGFQNGLFMTQPEGTDLSLAMRELLADAISTTEPYQGAYRCAK